MNHEFVAGPELLLIREWGIGNHGLQDVDWKYSSRLSWVTTGLSHCSFWEGISAVGGVVFEDTRNAGWMLICGGRPSVEDDFVWAERILEGSSWTCLLVWIGRWDIRIDSEWCAKSPMLESGSEPLCEATQCAYATLDISNASWTHPTSIGGGAKQPNAGIKLSVKATFRWWYDMICKGRQCPPGLSDMMSSQLISSKTWGWRILELMCKYLAHLRMRIIIHREY
jgi:hypothetical protein